MYKKILINILLIIIFVFIFIFIFIFINKYLKIDKIINSQVDNLNVKNYYIKIEEAINGENPSKREIYRLDNKQCMVLDNMKMVIDNEKNKTFIIIDSNKKVIVDESNNSEVFNKGLDLLDFLNLSNSFKDKLKYTFDWKIKTEIVDNVECYHIKISDNDIDYDIWLTKSDLLLKKYIENYIKTNETRLFIVEDIKLNNVDSSIFDIENAIKDYEILD